MQVVNKVMNHLLSIYTLGLKFGGVDKLEIVTDAFFINDIKNRKSL